MSLSRIHGSRPGQQGSTPLFLFLKAVILTARKQIQLFVKFNRCSQGKAVSSLADYKGRQQIHSAERQIGKAELFPKPQQINAVKSVIRLSIS